MYQENETVVATKSISSLILKGTKGVIHSIYDNGKSYLVEFVDDDGNTIADGLETVCFDDIELYSVNKK